MKIHGDAKSLREQGDRLFSAKQPLDLRNQEIAEQFYPQRATFTVNKTVGEDFAGHLMTSYPALVQRDLGNALGSMLRPRGRQWFHMATQDKNDMDHESKEWLEWAAKLQHRAMYDRKTMFARATKEGDHDFAAFGQAVISTEVNRGGVHLVYRCWHTRDVVWVEDSYGQIYAIHRNWKPTVRELCSHFSEDDLHPAVLKAKRDGKTEQIVHIRHVMIRADEYDREKKSIQPWVSTYLDCSNDHLIEDTGSWTQTYTIPRWMTVSGSQYAYSPATLIALPDARLIQAMTLTLLDAGERAANPPLIGVAEAVRGDLNIYPGGFTAVDAAYDERLGEVLRPLTTDKSGIPFAMDMIDRQSMLLKEAFYLNSLELPPTGGPDMTAYEVGQRVQEYIRKAMPLFEPMEYDYNGALCDITFETLLREGAFGGPDKIPEGLQGEDIQFAFESPLSEAEERGKGQTFLEAKAMIAEAMAMDPSAASVMNFGDTLRDVLDGIGAPAKWLNSPEEVEATKAAEQQAAQADQLLAQMQGGAQVADTLGSAAQRFNDARMSGGAAQGAMV
jgi:hypothetical protein